MDKNFAGQNLNGRSFRGQDLRGADFSGCQLKSCDFTDADLTDAKFCRTALGVDGEYRLAQWLVAVNDVTPAPLFVQRPYGRTPLRDMPVFANVAWVRTPQV